MSQASQAQANTCCICLETAQSRGGVPLYSPGCCGKWFHQSCIDLVIANGDSKCPACRAVFPTAAASVPPAPAAVQRRSLGGLFGFGRSNSNSNVMPPPAPVNAAAPRPIMSAVDPNNPPVFQQQQQIQQQPFHLFTNNNNVPNNFVPNTYRNQTRLSDVNSEFSDTEDRLETSAVAAKSTDKKTASAAVPLPVVRTSTSPEFPVASTAANGSFYVRVGLKFEENTVHSDDKVPLDIVCILDNSGSMSGSKLASLKEAMNFVIGCLTPQDRLSIVYFNSYAGAVHGLLKMTPENKEKSRRLLATLEATGGTDIYDGMRVGWNILENRQTSNPTACVFLLTDGQDRGRLPEKQELARTIKSRGASLFVFGFGADHDSQHMAAIADAGECPFTYIESDDMVVDAFGGSIGTQQGASVRNITLTVTAQAEGVIVAQAITGSYAHTILPGGRSVEIRFANMYVGESRDVLVKMSLPELGATDNEYPVVDATASYSVQLSGSEGSVQATSTTAHCIIRRVPQAEVSPTMTRDVEVDVQLNRIRSVEAITSALQAADNSNFGTASDILNAALAAVKASISFLNAHRVSLAIASDLTDALTRVQSRSAYAQGGRAMMSETSVNNDRQRSCYTKAGRANAYQSASSEICQQSAFASKSATKKW